MTESMSTRSVRPKTHPSSFPPNYIFSKPLLPKIFCTLNLLPNVHTHFISCCTYSCIQPIFPDFLDLDHWLISRLLTRLNNLFLYAGVLHITNLIGKLLVTVFFLKFRLRVTTNLGWEITGCCYRLVPQISFMGKFVYARLRASIANLVGEITSCCYWCVPQILFMVELYVIFASPQFMGSFSRPYTTYRNTKTR